MSLHPGTATYNPAGSSDFTRKAEALALGITNWSTPKATDGANGGPGQSYGWGGTPPLPAQAAQWQTPVADDQVDRLRGKINSPDSVTRADGKNCMDILHYRAEQGFTHPDPVITPHGPTLSQFARIWRPLRASMMSRHGRGVWRRLMRSRRRRRLNPLFVEWLMGWPPGHALCGCSETEFTHWQRDMRGALSALPTASGPWIWKPPTPETQPQQLVMFEETP